MEDVPVEWETDVETTLLGLSCVPIVGNIPSTQSLDTKCHFPLKWVKNSWRMSSPRTEQGDTSWTWDVLLCQKGSQSNWKYAKRPAPRLVKLGEIKHQST